MASGGTYADVQFLQGGYVLRTTGAIIGRVQKAGVSFRRQLNSRDNNGRGLAVLQEWWNMVVFKKGHSLEEQGTFCRTISCGNWAFNDDIEYITRMNAISTTLSEQLPRLKFPLASSSTTGKKPDEKERLALIISACWAINRRKFIISNTGIIGSALVSSSRNDSIGVLPAIIHGMYGLLPKIAWKPE